MKNKKRFVGGFTIVELAVVIVVISVLASITYIAYVGIQKKVVDMSLDADVQRMAALQTKYKSDHGSTGVAYYSGNGTGSSLGFTPKSGNVIDVVINSTGYCVRGYNVKGTENSIYSPSIKESSPGVCSQITASLTAIADSPPDPNGSGGGGGSGSGGTVLAQKISAGESHTCAIDSSNNAYCWGSDEYGKLGNNSTTNSSIPVAVNTAGVLSGKTIKSISSGYMDTCVIASDNLAYCWGGNDTGQLGNNSTTESHVPVAVDTTGALSGKTIKSISAGLRTTCVIASDDLAYCWGYNYYGNLGNNSTNQSQVPVAVNTDGVLSGKTVKNISVGYDSVCVIASDDQAYCWGADDYGQLGNNSTNQSQVPVAVNTDGVLSGKTVKSISTGAYLSCAIASDDQAYCWGWNTTGQLGNNSITQSNVPVAVSTSGVFNGKTIKKVYAGYFYACAIASDNLSYCWGGNGYGQLGNNSTTNSWVPVAVTNTGALAGKNAVSLALTNYSLYTWSLYSDNKIYCWGNNDFGRFGNNTTTGSLVPTITQSPPNW